MCISPRYWLSSLLKFIMFLYEARQRVSERKKLLEKRGEDFEKARSECASAQLERSRLQGFHKNVHEKAILAKLLSIVITIRLAYARFLFSKF
jgi:hypothetical protein